VGIAIERPGKRQRKPNIVTNVSEFGDIGYAAAVEEEDCKEESDTPTVREALNGSHADEWQQSIQNENDSLRKRNVFTIVDLPAGRKALKAKYILKLKSMAEGRKKYKARLVVLGCNQREGIDYLETFAPVAKGGTIRLLLALAQLLKLHVHQMDVDTAFLYAPLAEEIYMKAPEGMGGVLPGQALRLNKSLYGLKQAPMNFNNHIDEFIRSLGFKRCISDHCLYVMREGDDITLLVLYVDDIVIAGTNLQKINRIKERFSSQFAMKDLGELQSYLGMDIERDGDRSLKIHQGTYARKIVKKFRRYLRANTRTRSKVPMYRDMKLSRSEKMTESQQAFVDSFPYQEILGSLSYLAIHTRPDIAYAVNACARFSNQPTFTACRVLIRILEYISNTFDVGITYSGEIMDFHGFCDSDWAGDQDTRRSTTGFLAFMAGGPIAWQSRLQTTIAASSMEAEYMAAFALIQEICWLRGVMSELGFELEEPTRVYMDSQSAIDLANNPVHHKRSKHIAIKYHWLRQKIREMVVTLQYVPSPMQLADMLTKALAETIFEPLVDQVVG
jgi:hypothetical protein